MIANEYIYKLSQHTKYSIKYKIKLKCIFVKYTIDSNIHPRSLKSNTPPVNSSNVYDNKLNNNDMKYIIIKNERVNIYKYYIYLYYIVMIYINSRKYFYNSVTFKYSKNHQ